MEALNAIPSKPLLVLFIVGVFGIGSAIGIMFTPGPWYEGLNKPFFNPPNWLFGPAWAVLYVMIAVAGWRTVLEDPTGLRSSLWFAQMAFNFLWSPVVFGLQMLWPGVAVIGIMLALIIAFIVTSWNADDHVSAWLFVPYAAWVMFAATLNVTLAVLNPSA